MAKAWPRIALRAFDALILCIGFATALLLSGGAVEPLNALMPLLAVPLCVPICLAPKRARLALTLPLAALGGMLAWLASPGTGTPQTVYVLLSLLMPLVAAPLLGGPRMTAVQAALVIFQLAAGLLARDASFAALQPLIRALGVMQVVLLLFHVNLTQLREQCGGALARVLPGNLGMTAVVAAAVLLLANLSAVWSAIKAGIRRVVLWILALMDGLLGETFVAQRDMGENGLFQSDAQGEPSAFGEIVQYVVLALAAAALLYLLYRAARRAPALLRRLWDRLARLLRRYRDAVNADYTDELQALQGADARGGALKRLRGRLKRAPDWRSLDNRRRVREAYRRLSLKARPGESLTAREALGEVIGAPQLADAYDRARYSGHAVTDAEAEAAREALK